MLTTSYIPVMNFETYKPFYLSVTAPSAFYQSNVQHMCSIGFGQIHRHGGPGVDRRRVCRGRHSGLHDPVGAKEDPTCPAEDCAGLRRPPVWVVGGHHSVCA